MCAKIMALMLCLPVNCLSQRWSLRRSPRCFTCEVTARIPMLPLLHSCQREENKTAAEENALWIPDVLIKPVTDALIAALLCLILHSSLCSAPPSVVPSLSSASLHGISFSTSLSPPIWTAENDHRYADSTGRTF